MMLFSQTYPMVCKSGSSISQAEKITNLETTQKSCCAKNAALETKLAASEAKIALLEKQYEGIDEVCKTTASDGDGRRLASASASGSASGCGGGGAASMDNAVPGLTGGEIAAIVIVPIVVLLGCAGAFMYMQKQQSQKDEKTPENLYELKNFTPKNASVELFDARGSMNSNNPMANVVVSGSNPMVNRDIAAPQQIGGGIHSDELQVNVVAESSLPLPLNWEKVDGANGEEDSYYWNTETNETQYERPL